MLDIKHSEKVAMYIYIKSSRIGWITRKMLEYTAFAEDVLLRQLSHAFKMLGDSYIIDNKADCTIGKIECQTVDSAIYRRSALLYDKDTDAFILKLRLVFPTAGGTTISGKKTARFLSDILKLVDNKTAYGDAEDTKKRFCIYLRKQQIRRWCQDNGYVAFVANGSILPRREDTDEPDTPPLTEKVVLFT